MAARGSFSKTKIMETMLKVFPGSFLYNGGKELRIQCMEGGELIQVKCSFTCAKENVDGGSDTVAIADNATPKYREPTAEELDEVQALLKELGISSEV